MVYDFPIFPSYGLTCLPVYGYQAVSCPSPHQLTDALPLSFNRDCSQPAALPLCRSPDNVLFLFIAFPYLILLFLKNLLSQNMQSTMFCQPKFLSSHSFFNRRYSNRFFIFPSCHSHSICSASFTIPHFIITLSEPILSARQPVVTR